ncbi:S1C family serine protease [Bacillus solitudinis]|uniref:S1C family serine protease n=1 Tax=Bacillus solitudinis TaxID=2014074 RepID=UPI000C23E0DA|nr:trypsin-like peptidase domain-containing protein [Bacillus solitudinis]
MEHNNLEIIDYEKIKRRKEKKSKTKSFFLTLTAGVIGSALTLSVVPYTDYYHNLLTNEGVAEVNQSNSSLSFQQTSTATTNSVADIVEASSPAIVGIVNVQQQNNRFSQTMESVESGMGSGVIFDKREEGAFIVTNHHVIEGATDIEVSLYNGEKVKAELIGSDALTDLAVLKINPEHVTATLAFGDSSQLRSGDTVLAIGNPLGLDLSRTVTQGIVSGVDRTINVSTSAGEWELDVIQTDAAINPGNSGGALINTQGQVIGINSLKISENGVEGLGFAIPSNELLPIINEIIEHGQIERPYIGVGLAGLEEVPQYYRQNLSAEITNGVLITNVDPNSSAAEAGLQVEDIITSIDGTQIEDASDLRKYLYSEREIGDEIELHIYRENQPLTMKVMLKSSHVSE